jgi:hypothetical protein
MDIISYQKQRDADLKEFEEQYGALKEKYMAAISSAVYEDDIQKQAEFVKTVLELNANLSSEVRAFVSKIGDNYDPKAVQHLTDDLIKYQEEYASIQHANDMTKTLEMILHEDQSKIKDIRFQFNLYIGLLIIGIAIILFYIFWLSMPSLQVQQ